MRSVLLIRLSSLGDVVLMSALIEYINRKEPFTRISLLTSGMYTELFSSDPRIDEVFDYSGAHWELKNKLLNRRWSRIVDLQNNSVSRRIRGWFPANNSPAIGVFNKRYLNRALLLFCRINRYKKGDSVVRRYIQAYDPCFRDQKVPDLKIHINEASDSHVYKLLEKIGKSKALGMAPFAAWRNKQWPADFFGEVGTAFLRRGFRVLIFGGPAEREASQRLADSLGEGSECLAGKYSLFEQAGIMKRCSVFLGNDSGPVHLARACGVPTGTIYGSTTRDFGFAPYGETPFKIFEVPLICRPCHPQGGNRCMRLNRKCLIRIEPRAVVDGLMCLVDYERQVIS